MWLNQNYINKKKVQKTIRYHSFSFSTLLPLPPTIREKSKRQEFFFVHKIITIIAFSVLLNVIKRKKKVWLDREDRMRNEERDRLQNEIK